MRSLSLSLSSLTHLQRRDTLRDLGFPNVEASERVVFLCFLPARFFSASLELDAEGAPFERETAGGMVVLHLRKLGGISLSRKGKGAGVDVEVDWDAAGDDVAAFRKIVTAALDLDEGAWERLRLVYKGRVLHDYDGGLPDFREKDVVSYALALEAPDYALRAGVDGGFEEQEELDLRFDIESLPSQWQRKLADRLRRNLRLSDAALSVIFALTPEGYAMVVLWFLLGRVASALDMGPVYLLLSIVLFIFTNLGRRREGEASAYSIFNDFQTLPGQLTADQLDRQMVRGHIT